VILEVFLTHRTKRNISLSLRVLTVKKMIHEVYWKVPALGQRRNAGLTNAILAAVSFKIVSLGMHTAIPSFFPEFRSTMEVIFLNAMEYRFVPFGCQILFQNVIPSVSFSIWERKKNHRGLSLASREDGER
jgi:hypothetical protein